MEKEIELIPFLERVMKRTTKLYQEDFSGDCARLKYAADNPGEEHTFYWMARPCGTWLVTERDAFLNEFPRSGELYRLWSTTPGDK